MEPAPVRRTQSLWIAVCMVGFVMGGVSSSSNISTEWLWSFWAIAIAYQQSIGKNNLDEHLQNYKSIRISGPIATLNLVKAPEKQRSYYVAKHRLTAHFLLPIDITWMQKTVHLSFVPGSLLSCSNMIPLQQYCVLNNAQKLVKQGC